MVTLVREQLPAQIFAVTILDMFASFELKYDVDTIPVVTIFVEYISTKKVDVPVR
jgi:hypothetical protein